MKLYIMRHGETDWNLEVRLQGCADILLNENGRKLAVVTGQALKDVEFAAVFSSPLSRAMETARLVLGERKTPIIPEKRIQEIGFGEWEGRRCGKEFNEVPREQMLHFFSDTENYTAPPGGEDLSELLGRTRDFYEELVHTPQYEDSNILISSHGAACRALMQSVYKDGDFWQGSLPKNCSVTVVEVKNGEVVSVDADRIYYDDFKAAKTVEALFE